MSLAELFYLKETFREHVRRWKHAHFRRQVNVAPFTHHASRFSLEALEPRLLLSVTASEVVASQQLEPAAITVPAGSLPSLDVDLNGQADALSDGIVIIRHLFGFTGNTLTDGAVDPAGQRTDPTAIQNYLNSINSALDVDLNQQADALSDGIMIIRSLFGFTGTALTSGAIDPAGQRTDQAAIAAFLDNMNPQRELAAPLLTAGLQQDTGISATDRTTFNPTITGTMADINQIASFTAGFDATPIGNFVDVLANLLPSGVFTLSTAVMNHIAGGILADGTHTLHLQATDARGNIAALDRLFTLDTTVTTLTFDLDSASDTTPVGDQQTTDAVVSLRGQTEPNAVVELVGLGLPTTADQTGTVAFANVPLAIGANLFTVRSTDIAGNQSTLTRTITRLLADSDGDGTPDSQEGAGPNGGDANSDGIPDSQQSNVVSVLNSANQYLTLVAPAAASFSGVQALSNPSPSDAPAEVTFPLGFVDFQLTGLVGGAATVDLLLPAGVTVNTYWKYGATPDNVAPHWYEFLYDGTTGAEINGSIVTLHFQDGARGDNDLTINGSIVDPSGPGFVVNHAPSGADKTITINEDTPYTFTAADFGFSDPNDSPANDFQAVKITTLPAAGALMVGGAVVNAGDLVSLSSVPAGAIWTARESSRVWRAVASSEDGTKLVAAAFNDQLYTSTDSGITWTGRESIRNWVAVGSSADGMKLVAGVNAGQLYTSTDAGVTWTARESTRNWEVLASSEDGTKLVAGVDGGQLYTSTDAGVTWTARESSRNWLAVASSADGMKLVAAERGGRLHTSTDAGLTWATRETPRNWSFVASSADGMKLVAGVHAGQLYMSTDAGVTWTARESSRNWETVASSADGMKLVAGVNGGQLYTSRDAGVSWTARESTRNWEVLASSADGTKLVAGVDGGQLYTSAASLGLVFTPAVTGSGSPYTSFTFQVQDDGGTFNGGADLDPTPNTLTFNVTAVNQGVGNWIYSGTKNHDGVSSAVSASGFYSVAANGTLTLDGTSMTGNMLADGSTFILASTSGQPVEISVGLRMGGTFNNASLTGSYGVTLYYSDAPVDLPPLHGFHSEVGTLTFDGVGNFTYSGNKNTDGVSSVVSASGSYSVAANGTLILGGTNMTGNVLADGSTFILASTSGQPVEIGMGVKIDGTFTNASLTGTYAIAMYSSDAVPFPGNVFSSELGQVTFDGAGSFTYLSEKNRGGVTKTVAGSGTYSVAGNGALTFASTSGTPHSGNVLAGGNTFILASTSGQPVEIGVGVKKGGTFSNASLTGSYAITSYYSDSPVDLPPLQGFYSEVGTMTFDGASNLSLPPPTGTIVSFRTTTNGELAIPGQVDSMPVLSPSGVATTNGSEIGGGVALQVEQTVPLDLELVAVAAAPASAMVQSAGLSSVPDLSLAYVQQSWVTDFVGGAAIVTEDDKELLIALPA